MYTIDIDTGGTFTDGFFTCDGAYKSAKVLTTPHDLTVCLANCIREGAKLFGVSYVDMLAQSDVVRYSTTTGVNALITGTGAKIGLIVSKGYRDSLYAADGKDAQPIYSLLSRELIVEVEGGVDDEGMVSTPLDREEVLAAMQYLIDMGARGIAVSLKNAHLNQAHEKGLKRIIKEQYPNYYLGSVRVFLASEISDHPGDFNRTNTVVVNGYIHDVLVKYLYKSEDELRANFCTHPLMVAHSHGGVARVAKTRAIDTYSSGPGLGLIGAGTLGRLYGFDNVITVDVGGTSLDIGIIVDGVYSSSSTPLIGGLPVSVPMITTYSAPIASGSLARIDASQRLAVGPKSAGARPGPVCFDLGGMEPTVTDADVVLGFIDPDYFLGGRIRLNKKKAEAAVKSKIADRLGVGVQEAAWMIREEMGRMSAREIVGFAASHGIDARGLADFAVVVYGGAGPTHFADFIRELDFGHALATPYASVFSAFGASTTDLLHSYSRFVSIRLREKGGRLADYRLLDEVVGELLDGARRDIAGEGFPPERACYCLELTAGGRLEGAKITTDRLRFDSESEIAALCSSLAQTDGPISISSIVLNARVPMPHLQPKTLEPAGADPLPAYKGSRRVFWSPSTGELETPVYELELLKPGNVVGGPAIVEARDTTYVIPGVMSLHMDEYGNTIMKKAAL